MRSLHLRYLCALCSGALVATTLGDPWVDKTNDQITKISDNPTIEDVIFLCATAAISPRNEERAEIAALAFERLCSIPDFTEKLVQYIETEKAKWKAGGWAGEYNSRRYRVLERLGRVPDPRVVKMLGEMLTDMEWTRDPIEYTLSGADYSLPGPNGLLAAKSLAMLVKGSPVDKNPNNYLVQDVEAWRQWYEEVKLGNKAFSFNGQALNYRFKPDGSWEVTSVSASQDKAYRIQRRPPKSNPQDAPSINDLMESIAYNGWPWIIGVSLAIFSGCWWFTRKCRRTRIK